MKTDRRSNFRKWHPPTPDFLHWWEPDGYNPQTGAQTGGHPEALRKCVRPETAEVRYYGIESALAFNTRCYREEYLQWFREGQPPRGGDYDGTAAPMANVRECMEEIKAILSYSPIVSGAERKVYHLADKPRSEFQKVKAIMEHNPT